MSNPMTGLWPLNGSLSGTPSALTGVDPIRYSNGLWLEEASSNAVKNPIAAATANNWNVFANRQVDRITSLPGPLPEPYTSLVTTGLKFTATSNLSNSAATTHQGLVLSNAPWMQIGYFWIPSSWTGGTPDLQVSELTSVAGATVAPVNLSLRDQWQAVAMGPFTPDAGDTTGTYTIGVLGNYNSGEFFYFTLAGFLPGGYLTSIPVGSFGNGFAWTGTAHNSSSTRAASSASVTMDEPASVACWYREGYSGAKQFAYLEPYGTLGTYGSIAWSGGTLTLSTSRNLVIGPFAAFDRALTAGEQANLRSTQNWTMNSVNGSNIILPLSGARRRRR